MLSSLLEAARTLRLFVSRVDDENYRSTYAEYFRLTMQSRLAATLAKMNTERGSGNLRGLYVEADPHDPVVRSQFEGLWSAVDGELELRTESWAPPGAASDEHLQRVLDRFRSWVNALISHDLDHEHR